MLIPLLRARDARPAGLSSRFFTDAAEKRPGGTCVRVRVRVCGVCACVCVCVCARVCDSNDTRPRSNNWCGLRPRGRRPRFRRRDPRREVAGGGSPSSRCLAWVGILLSPVVSGCDPVSGSRSCRDRLSPFDRFGGHQHRSVRESASIGESSVWRCGTQSPDASDTLLHACLPSGDSASDRRVLPCSPALFRLPLRSRSSSWGQRLALTDRFPDGLSLVRVGRSRCG